MFFKVSVQSGKCCKRVNVQVVFTRVVKSSFWKCCKRVNVKVFQSDKCEKVLSSHHFVSVAKELM